MAEEQKELEIQKLETYLSKVMDTKGIRAVDILVEGIMVRTIMALEAGATSEDIVRVYRPYVSAWNPDRTYG
ncbi:MAG TPA: hypothetical protein VJA23_03125 [Candidatus Nanoarchaeia archaeon]|nr:hypothetical protein [Candidatus Nanoarchaeia archaeon]